MYKKLLYSGIFTLLLVSVGYAQQHNPGFYVKKLMEGGRHETQMIGIGFPSKQWKYYQEFKSLANEKQLVKHCHHPNNVIRAYSFQALLDLNIEAARGIYKSQENSNRMVEVFHGCAYSGKKSLFELYGQLVYDRFGSSLPYHGGPPSEDDSIYLWFMQKDK